MYAFWIIALVITIGYLTYINVKQNNRIKYLEVLKPRDLWLIKQKIMYMSPREFETFCTILFRMLGYRAEVTKETKDGGKDIILYNKASKEFIFVECKHWKECEVKNLDETSEEFNDINTQLGHASAITQDIAQKLRGAMDYGFNGRKPIERGIIMTTTKFSDQCEKYCNAMNIEMVDFDGIMEMIKEIGTTKLYAAVGINIEGELI